MERRLTRLEEQMVGVRDDLRDIKRDIRDLLNIVPTLGTKRDLQTYTLTGIGLALAVIAIVIGVWDGLKPGPSAWGLRRRRPSPS